MGQVLMTGAVFSVERRQCPCPGGKTVTRDVVVHPGAVVILPLLEDGSVVLIRNYRDCVESWLYELPAGTLEPKETPEECALRELEEETGYRASRLERLCEFYTTPGICTERMRAFVARGLTAGRMRLTGSELIQVAVTPADEVRRMLRDGVIEDGKTLVTLGRFLLNGQEND